MIFFSLSMEVFVFTALVLSIVLANEPKQMSLQDVAQARVQYMADRNYRWHPPFNSPAVPSPWKYGARFEGCGWGGKGRNPKTLGTCTPRRRMRLVADAVATGKYGTYRLRLWK